VTDTYNGLRPPTIAAVPLYHESGFWGWKSLRGIRLLKDGSAYFSSLFKIFASRGPARATRFLASARAALRYPGVSVNGSAQAFIWLM
jgi:hypothetical protein